MLVVVSSPGMGRGWRSASEVPEAQGSPGVQTARASVPGAGPTTAPLQEEGQAGLLSKSMCLSGACGGRESLGAA